MYFLGIRSNRLHKFEAHMDISWHHSIDPSNILVVSRSHDSSYDCDFKIANLGLAHFQRYISSLSDATDNDRYGISTHGVLRFTIPPKKMLTCSKMHEKDIAPEI